MPVSLANIPRNDSKNTPGYSVLYGIYEKHVSAIAAAVNGDVATAISLISPNVWNKIEFDHESGAWSESVEQEGEGQYGQIRTTLQGHISGNNAALKAGMEKFMGVPCIWVGKRKSDSIHEILGEIGCGIILKFAQVNAGRGGNQNGWNFSGNQDYNHFPYDYSIGTLVTE